MGGWVGDGALGRCCVLLALQTEKHPHRHLPTAAPLHAITAGQRDRLGQLPDSQRREAAAAMVMQLMTAMGLDAQEDSEEEEDEEGPPGA